MIRHLSAVALMALTCPPATAQENCPAHDSRNWHAWIDRGTENGEKRLVVTGQVDLPTPGYSALWENGPLDRMSPPTLRFRMTLTAPSGIAAQVITQEDLTVTQPTDLSECKAVKVLCGDRILADIANVRLSD